MGKVEAFGLPGIDCWFWSHDHRPPHFNARRRGQWQFKVFFLQPRERMLERKPRRGHGGTVAARDLKALCDLAERHREALLREWERKVQNE